MNSNPYQAYGGTSIWPGEAHPSFAGPQYPGGMPQGGGGMGMGTPQSWGGGGGTWSSTGNSQLDLLRSLAGQDAFAGIHGARLAAMNSAPNDPSQAAYGGLSALLGGQTNMAHGLNQAAGSYMQQQQANQWQEHMARLMSQLQMDQWRQMQPSAWQTIAGIGGQVAGNAAGGWLGHHGW